MASKRSKTALKVLGYVAFTFVSLLVAFFLTFPYDALKDRLRAEADGAGYSLKVASLGPGFFSLRAKDVQLAKKSESDPPPEALRLDSISVGPTLFPPGVGVNVNGLGGSLDVALSPLGTTRLKVDAKNLDLSKGNMKGFSGIDFSGTVDAHVDLSIPSAATGPKEPDLSLASGAVSLDTHGLTINGGTASIPIPQFGPDPTPMDLPKIALGDITGRVKIDKGAATVDDFRSKSSDLEAGITGGFKLGKRVDYSEATMEVRLKADPEFQKRLGLLGSAFSIIPPDPKDPAWRLGHLTGMLGRPQFH